MIYWHSVNLKLRKSEITNCWQNWSNNNSYLLLVEGQHGTTTLDKCAQAEVNMHISCVLAITLLSILRKTMFLQIGRHIQECSLQIVSKRKNNKEENQKCRQSIHNDPFAASHNRQKLMKRCYTQQQNNRFYVINKNLIG